MNVALELGGWNKKEETDEWRLQTNATGAGSGILVCRNRQERLCRADVEAVPRYACAMKSQKNRYALSCATLFTLLIVALLIPRMLGAQDLATAHVNIQVTDATGSGLPRVMIHLDPSPEPKAPSMETDAKGLLALSLKPGGYELFVNFPGFEPIVSRIDVKPTREVQTVPIQLEIGGKNSPGVIRDEVAPVDELRISAYTKHEDLKLKVADLKAMPRTTVSVHNEHSKADETYTGVAPGGLARENGSATRAMICAASL